jgi:hypothetical protein
MSTRITTTQRLDAQDARLDRIESLLTLLVEGQTVKATPQAPKPKATPKRQTGKALTRENRKEFVKVAPWARGMSTKEIAAAVVSGAQKCPKGFRIGAGYTALVS